MSDDGGHSQDDSEDGDEENEDHLEILVSPTPCLMPSGEAIFSAEGIYSSTPTLFISFLRALLEIATRLYSCR